jgi:hypothetical protein
MEMPSWGLLRNPYADARWHIEAFKTVFARGLRLHIIEGLEKQ